MLLVPPDRPILSSTTTLAECPNCLVAVRGERLDAYVTCIASEATRANITVGGKTVQVQKSTPGEFLPAYTVTKANHMVNVTCSVGNDDVEPVLTTSKTLYVAGSMIYTIISKFELE